MSRSLVVSLLVTVGSGLLLAQANRPVRNSLGPSSADGSSSVGRGVVLFAGKGECLSCHEVRGHGSPFGTDLSGIGARSTRAQVEQWLLEPATEVSNQYLLYEIIMKGGARYTGKLLNQDAFSLQVLDSKERLLSFERSNVLKSGFVPAPPMPSYKNKLSLDEVHDISSFLLSLK